MVAYLIDVGGPEAFLAAGKTFGRRGLLAHEEGLERDHTGAGEKQGRVAGGYQRGGGHVLVALALEKFYEGISDLVAVHFITLVVTLGSTLGGFREIT